VFWLPSHAVDKPSLAGCLHEVGKLLLGYASDFVVDEDTTQSWLSFILEFQTIILGDLAHVLLSKHRTDLNDAQKASLHHARRKKSSMPLGNTPISEPLPDLQHFSGLMCATSMKLLQAEATWDQTDVALHMLAGWMGILMIHGLSDLIFWCSRWERLSGSGLRTCRRGSTK
jgi:hypothetical protein